MKIKYRLVEFCIFIFILQEKYLTFSVPIEKELDYGKNISGGLYFKYITIEEDELSIVNCLKFSKNLKKHFSKELTNKFANT